MESASLFSKLNFSWVSSLIRKGEQCQLQHVDDLFDLPHNLASESLGLKLEKAVKGNFNNVYGKFSNLPLNFNNKLNKK